MEAVEYAIASPRAYTTPAFPRIHTKATPHLWLHYACVKSKPTQLPGHTYPRCSGTSAAPHTLAALWRMKAKPALGGCPDKPGQAPQRSQFSLSFQAPTSCAFINDLLDLGLLRCALSGFLGWWGWGISSCLRLNPHVCVNFLVRILLFCTRKAVNTLVTGRS